jgi:hypothetical protein
LLCWEWQRQADDREKGNFFLSALALPLWFKIHDVQTDKFEI